MADFSAVINSVPPVTRFFLIGVATITFPCLLALVEPSTIALSWWRVRKSYEIWRPLTNFFFGGSGFPLLYDFFLIYKNSTTLEKDIYNNDTAEYAWIHLMLATFILTMNIPFGLPFLFRPMLHAQTYLWSRANPTLKISIFGLITIPTSLYPPALIVLDVLTGGPQKALGGILGVLAGHLWWYLSSYLPLHAASNIRRSNPLAVPARFRRLFKPAGSGTSTNTSWGGVRIAPVTGTSTGTSGTRSAAADAVRSRWGSGGQRLGGEPL